MVVRRLRSTDVRAFRRLRLEGLKESPTAFGSSYAEEVKRPLSHSRERIGPSSGKRIFGALENGRLIGIVALVRKEGRKERHKASIFGMYVTPSSRRKGVARKLLEAAIRRAMQLKGVQIIQLAVVTSNIAAMKLYKKAGFAEYGREEDALLISKKFYAESLMAKRL